MKLLDKIDHNFIGLICLDQEEPIFSSPVIQELNYLSNQLISQGKSSHENKNKPYENLYLTKHFDRDFFIIHKKIDLKNKKIALDNVQMLHQLIKKYQDQNQIMKFGIISAQSSLDVKIRAFISSLSSEFPTAEVERIEV